MLVQVKHLSTSNSKRAMKKFLKHCGLFILPIVLSLMAIELITAQIPNSYSYKYNYIKTSGDKIQALAIGHSQLYDGFKPESFFLPSFNLCNSAQNYVDNYYLLCELLHDMPNLKVVIMPIGYLNVDITRNDSSLTDRSCYYHKYMNIDYDGRVPLRYRLECYDPMRAGSKIVQHYLRHSDIVGCDMMGRRNTHYLRDRKHKLGYENILEGYTRKENDYSKFCLGAEYYLVCAFKMLMERNITIVLVSPPYYWNCGFKRVNEGQRRFLSEYMIKLCKKYPSIHYLNLESDTSYVYDDFFNETHLSEIGAEKFTRRLSDYVKEFISE